MLIIKNINKLWNHLTSLGRINSIEPIFQREIVLTNKICLLLIPLIVISIVLESINNNLPVVYSFLVFFGLIITILWLNSRHSTLLSRILLSSLPVLIIMTAPAISKEGTHEANYIGYAFATLGLSIVPLLIFNLKNEKKYLAAGTIYNLIFVAFYDKILLFFDSGMPDISYLESNYLIFKSTHLMVWVVYTAGILTFKSMNFQFEEQLRKNNTELQQKNNEILTQNEEIQSQNEELQQQQDQIVEQRDYIEEQNAELKVYQNKLLDYVFRISQTKDRLSNKEAENQSILNGLRQNFMVMEFDMEGNVTWLAPKTIDYLQFNKDEIIGTNGATFLISDEEDPNHESFNSFWKKLKTGQSITIERKMAFKETKLWIRCTFAPIKDENGYLIKVMSISEDISEIKEKEKEIREYNTMLQQQRKEIQEQNEELTQQKEEISTINETLEQRVKERTRVLELKNKQLSEYAFINAHLLRAPVSSILGLINLLGHEHLTKQGLELHVFLKRSAVQLDKVVNKINDAIKENKHFDREYLREDNNTFQ